MSAEVAGGPLADRMASRTMVEEEAHVHIVGKVHLETQVVFGDDLDQATLIQAFVLFPIASPRGLTTSMSNMQS